VPGTGTSDRNGRIALFDGPIEIRPYRESDEDDVVALWDEVFPDPAPRNEPRRVIRQKLKVQRELFFIARLERAVLGTAMGGYDGRRGWVYAVSVHPAHRDKGIGRSLMMRVEDELLRLGCAKVNLQIEGSNPNVVAFYERLGFAVEDRISMGKTLPSRLSPKG
jgi:ribosomal protein S18 acetylase RimI-like enzyme